VIVLHLLLWLAGGVAVGLFNMLLLVRSVRMMDPDTHTGSVGLVIVGFVFRYLVTIGLLALAVSRGLGPVLAAGSGLAVARWIGVLVANKGRARGPRSQE
jgi:hypothetical protein